MALKHRRLLWLSVFTLLFVFLAEELSHEVKGTFFWIFCAAAPIFFLLSLWKRRFFFLFLLMLLAAGAFLSSYQISHRKTVAMRLDEKEETLFSVTVTEPLGMRDEAYTFDGRLTLTENGRRVSLPVTISSPISAQPGDVLFGKGNFSLAKEDGYSEAHGLCGTVYFEECRVVDRLHGFTYRVGKLRTDLSERLRASLSGDGGELLCALLLGNKDGLPDTFTRDMKRIGTTHMLSLSGMHLAVLTAGIVLVLKKTGVGRRTQVFLLIAFAVFFMILTGLSASVMRAGLMFFFSSLPFFLREERDGLSSLSAAVAAIALFEPYAIKDISLWLSALSTLGILLFFERTWRKREYDPPLWRLLLRAALISLTVTLAASIATLPLILCIFGEIPLLSPLSNLILAPLVQALLYLSIFVAILGGFPPLVWITSKICNLVFTISRVLSDIPHTVSTLDSTLSVYLVYLLFGALLLYFLFCPKKRFRIRVPVSLLLVFTLTLGTAEGVLHLAHRQELTVLYHAEEKTETDVLLLCHKGKRVMTLFSAQKSVGKAESEAFSRVSGELDAFLLPYYTECSLSYADTLLRRYKIRKLYLPAPRTAGEYALYGEMLALAGEHAVPTVAFDGDTPFFFEFLTVSRLSVVPKEESPSAYAEFWFGYSRIGYFSSNALAYAPRDLSLNADLLVFGTYGGNPKVRFEREDLIKEDAEILCTSTRAFPFTDPEGFVFFDTPTAYLPMRTHLP